MSKQEELKRMAIQNGLCEEWQNEWGCPTDQELIDKYINGIDFAIANDFPSLEYIQRNFDRKLLNSNGIFCEGEINGKRDIMVLNGMCHGTIKAKDFDCLTIYARHDCIVEIEIKDFAFVTLYAYDNADIRITNRSYRRARVYNYSDNTKIVCLGDIMQKKRKFSDIYT